MALCRAPGEVMVTVVMAMVHYMPVPWFLVVYYRRANWQWHCWLWRDDGGVETNMQIKLAIIFFKHVFQRGHKIIPLANNDAAAADIQTLMKFYTSGMKLPLMPMAPCLSPQCPTSFGVIG
jgi:hypothetical protein